MTKFFFTGRDVRPNNTLTPKLLEQGEGFSVWGDKEGENIANMSIGVEDPSVKGKIWVMISNSVLVPQERFFAPGTSAGPLLVTAKRLEKKEMLLMDEEINLVPIPEIEGYPWFFYTTDEAGDAVFQKIIGSVNDIVRGWYKKNRYGQPSQYAVLQKRTAIIVFSMVLSLMSSRC